MVLASCYARVRRTEAACSATETARVLLWFANLSDGCYKMCTIPRSFGI
jgi:hypothetical protein